MAVAGLKLVCFDCDSTLSGIEGIDELGRLRGPAVFAQVEAMTNDAMNGTIPVQSVFGRRLEIIQPRREDVAAVGRHYIEAVEPTAKEAIQRLVRHGWTPAIISAGFIPAILPLADFLGIEHVFAVELRFNDDGSYAGFDEEFPATRSGGKPEIVRRLKEKFWPDRIVTVGDGVSDLETKPEVDLFVGFGRYVVRPRVKAEAGRFILAMSELPPIVL